MHLILSQGPSLIGAFLAKKHTCELLYWLQLHLYLRGNDTRTRLMAFPADYSIGGEWREESLPSPKSVVDRLERGWKRGALECSVRGDAQRKRPRGREERERIHCMQLSKATLLPWIMGGFSACSIAHRYTRTPSLIQWSSQLKRLVKWRNANCVPIRKLFSVKSKWIERRGEEDKWMTNHRDDFKLFFSLLFSAPSLNKQMIAQNNRYR